MVGFQESQNILDEVVLMMSLRGVWDDIKEISEEYTLATFVVCAWWGLCFGILGLLVGVFYGG